MSLSTNRMLTLKQLGIFDIISDPEDDLFYKYNGEEVIYDTDKMSRLFLKDGFDYALSASSRISFLNSWQPVDEADYAVARGFAINNILRDWLTPQSQFARSVNIRKARKRDISTIVNQYLGAVNSRFVLSKAQLKLLLESCYVRSLQVSCTIPSNVRFNSKPFFLDEENVLLKKMISNLQYPSKSSEMTDLDVAKLYTLGCNWLVPKGPDELPNFALIKPSLVALALFLAYRSGWIMMLDDVMKDFIDVHDSNPRLYGPRQKYRNVEEWEENRENLFLLRVNASSEEGASFLANAFGLNRFSQNSGWKTPFPHSLIIGKLVTPMDFRVASILSQLGIRVYDYRGYTFPEMCCAAQKVSVGFIYTQSDKGYDSSLPFFLRKRDWWKDFLSSVTKHQLSRMCAPKLIVNSEEELSGSGVIHVKGSVKEFSVTSEFSDVLADLYQQELKK